MRHDYDELWKGVKYRYLIRHTADFTVGIDDEYDVDWETTAEYDAAGPKDVGQHNATMNRAAELESIPSDDLPTPWRVNYKRMIGEAIVCSLKHDYNNAQKMLDKAEAYIADRTRDASRRWYATSSVATTIVITLFGILLWMMRDSVTERIGPTAFLICISGVTGAWGALLSILMRLGRSHLDCAAGRKLHYIEGSLRIASGMICAVVICIAIRAGLILTAFASGEKLPLVLALATMIAGASERWVPSIIRQVDSSRIVIPAAKGEHKCARPSVKGSSNEA